MPARPREPAPAGETDATRTGGAPAPGGRCFSRKGFPRHPGSARLTSVGVSMLHLIAQWAGATAYIALIACIVAATLAFGMSSAINYPADAAYRLARHMALVGGTAVLVACSASTLYYWLVGLASGRAALLIEMALLGAAAVFTLVAAMLLESGQRAQH